MSGVFGVWDAPMTDDLGQIPTPVGAMCQFCREDIAEGDNGVLLGTLGETPCFAQHRECSLRVVTGGIGHLVDHARWCPTAGPDAGLSFRESALLVWDYLHGGKPLTPAELEQYVAKKIGCGPEEVG